MNFPATELGSRRQVVSQLIISLHCASSFSIFSKGGILSMCGAFVTHPKEEIHGWGIQRTPLSPNIVPPFS